MKYKTILLFGVPGSGKGTQGKILGTIPNFFHVACGDVFRNLTVETQLGRTFVEYSSKGQLVPDAPTVQLWRQNILESTQAGRFNPQNDTLILDGIPRNSGQAKILSDTLDVRAVVHLVCSDKEKLVQRLQRRALRDNRLDDANLDVIRERLRVYELETTKVLDYYGPTLVHNLDSSHAPVHVLRMILDVIEKL